MKFSISAKTILAAVLTPALIISLTSCKGDPKPQSAQAFLLDTSVSLTLYDNSDPDILTQAMELCTDYENILSRTIPDSDVYKLNNAAGNPVKVSTSTIELVEKALYYSRLTDGKFDITISPVMDLWMFTSEAPVLPDKADIDTALGSVDYKNIVVKGDTVQLLNGAQIDFGGIAKGYIADRIADFLVEKGVKSAIIDLGGNILTVGEKPSGKPFIVGIQKPFEMRNTTIGAVEARNISVVSSGIYERGFTQDEKYYYHLLDPKTGYPADSGLQSVTVITPLSVDADALSTCLFVMGIEEGTSFAQSLPEVYAMFIDDNGEEHFTEGFKETLTYKETQ